MLSCLQTTLPKNENRMFLDSKAILEDLERIPIFTPKKALTVIVKALILFMHFKFAAKLLI